MILDHLYDSSAAKFSTAISFSSRMVTDMVSDVHDRALWRIDGEPRYKGCLSAISFGNSFSGQPDVSFLEHFTVRERQVDIYVATKEAEMCAHGISRFAPNHGIVVFPINRCGRNPYRSGFFDLKPDDVLFDESGRK